MGKDPAFLFYPNDYLGGTMGMTLEEKGAYIELLMTQFNRGHMTTHMIGQVVGHLWDNIKDKFTKDENGLWFNERLDLEKEKRKAFTDSRRNNISGNNQYTKKDIKKSGHMSGHTTSHMENRNVNEDKSVDVVEKNGYGETKKVMLTSDEYLKLQEKYGLTNLDIEIIALENYIVNGKGGKYKNHYLVLNNWLLKRKTENNGKQKPNRDDEWDRFTSQ